MATPRDQLAKRWRITAVEGWEQSDVDLLGSAFINFNRDRTGDFQVVALTGDIDYRISSEADGPVIEWSWAGDDDGTETSGRGWACLEGEELVGCIHIHFGEELPFHAAPETLRRVRGRTG